MLSEVSQSQKDEYCITPYEILECSESQRQRVEWWVAGLKGGIVSCLRVAVWEDEKFWRRMLVATAQQC